MRFDIYGQFEAEVVREDGKWAVYRMEGETRSRESDIVIPSGLGAQGVLPFLDDVYQEFAVPGALITLLD